MKKPTLIKDAGKVARFSWSFRLSIVASIFSGLEMALPLFSDAMPPHVFLIASMLVAVGSAAARLIAQPGMHDDT